MGRKALYKSGNRPVGTVSLTFDNLGEAAEVEMGALPADAPLGGHRTATEIVPALLERLAEREIAATFFVEGMNAELYPELLREVAARGHEVAYHAWRHEQWNELSAAGQAENLARGIDAFARIGIGIAGLRPPGGRLGPGGVGVLLEAGLRYCSPAGAGAGIENGLALLPFQWRHLDASCVLPPLAGARERMTGSADPVEPATFVAFLEAEIERLAEDGGYLAIVLHPFMLEWLGEGSLDALLDRIAAAAADGLRVARCVDVADDVLANPARFAGGTVLDATSWAQ
jgi:peptidoglycan/xylan/chitin deacetylase (PgdA/CDA1 family)